MKTRSFQSGRLTIIAAALSAAGLAIWLTVSHHAGATTDSAPKESTGRNDAGHILVPDNSPLRKALQIQTVEEGSISIPFSLPATVEPDPVRFVRILTPLTGKITAIHKQLGDDVKPGDVLLSIDSADLAQAISDNDKARLAMTLARKNLDRQKEFDQSGLAAKRDLEQAQNDYEQALSEFQRAGQKLSQLGAKAGTAGQLSTGHTLAIRSPIAGKVIDFSAANGAYWNDSNAALMTVADISRVFITASAKEKDLPNLYAGQEVSIHFDAFPQPVSAKVQYVGDMLDPDTRTLKVRMLLQNPDRQLKPGMFAQAEFLGKAHQGIAVPATAVIQKGFTSKVFVELAKGEYESRVVRTGSQSGNRIEILSGLKGGEKIVTKDGVLLND